MLRLPRIRAEPGPMLRIAIPVVLAELGWMAMGVDALLRGYFAVIVWSSPFLLRYAAFRRYLQGLHIVKPMEARRAVQQCHEVLPAVQKDLAVGKGASTSSRVPSFFPGRPRLENVRSVVAAL